MDGAPGATVTGLEAREGLALYALTVCEAFQITAAENAERVALRTPGGKLELTFAEVAKRVQSIATGLYSLGVRRGDTVGLMLLNRPQDGVRPIAEAVFASLFAIAALYTVFNEGSDNWQSL